MAKKKSTVTEVDQRIDRIARMLVNAGTSSQIRQFCRSEWGVSNATCDGYLKRARAIIRADYSTERQDFLASRLGVLDKVIQQSLKSGQHSNAIGAMKLQCQLTQLINSSN